MAQRKKKKKAAKKKAQTKRKKTRAKKETKREPKIHVNKELPDLANLTPPKVHIVSDNHTLLLDHDKAYEYCDLPIFKGERNISEAHVQTLYDKMRRKLFNWRLVILSSAIYKGVRYKINGQHTCWAFVNLSPEEVRKLYGDVHVRELIYRVDSHADMKSVYGMYDGHLSRTDQHLTKLQLVGEAVISGVSMSLVGPLVGGMKFWLFEKKHERQRYGPEENAALVAKHNVTLRHVAEMLKENTDNIKILKRQAVVAAMFSTFDKVPTIAKGFWQPVADGLSLDSKNDPRYRLRALLQETVVGAAGRSNLRPMSTEDMYRVSISAWNKWRKDDVAMTTIRATKARTKPV